MKKTNFASLLAVAGGLALTTAACNAPKDEAADTGADTEVNEDACTAEGCTAEGCDADACAAKACEAKACEAEACAAKGCEAKGE